MYSDNVAGMEKGGGFLFFVGCLLGIVSVSAADGSSRLSK